MKIDAVKNINSKAVVLPDGNTYQLINGEVYQIKDEFSLGELGFKKAFKKLKKFAGKKLLSKFGGRFGISPWAVGAGVAAGGYLLSKKKKKKKRASGGAPVANIQEASAQPNKGAYDDPAPRQSFEGDTEKPSINWIFIGGAALVTYLLLRPKNNVVRR